MEPGEAQGDVMAAVEDTEIWAEPVDKSNDKVTGNLEKETIIHKVKAGETLSSIAKAYEVSIDDIKTTNNLRRNAVRVGQQLKITTSAPQVLVENTVKTVTNKPAINNTQTQQKKPTTTQKKPASDTKATSHSVKKGESLSTIARKYGVTISALKSANGLKNDNLRIGQKLKIPAKTSTGKKRR